MTEPPIHPVTVDRAHVIRRSIRCFTLGAIGVIPILGLPTGYLAMRLQRQIAAEIRERWNFLPLHLYWAVSVFAAAGIGFAGLPFLSLALVVLTFFGHFYMTHRVAERAEPGEWNPAARWVYWGVALAYAGRALTCALVIGVIVVVALNMAES